VGPFAGWKKQPQLPAMRTVSVALELNSDSEASAKANKTLAVYRMRQTDSSPSPFHQDGRAESAFPQTPDLRGQA
jgi:hypothetical protein